ncbi:Uma2 family endonuclease [Paenibacillus hamazuiensis]|uniref:Uma2 family endonuclease n=1 Tax=Paenibacillus hamazuiensis TaxID=2936508 RepID=UPI00200F3AC1|nr:Uma2 family endonuclease [Paenibacillus hamazuiensis]
MSMGMPSDKPYYTYGDYLQWPEGIRVELIDGKVYNMSPGPNRIHQEIFGTLFNAFFNYLKDKPCKVYAAPFDVRLPKSSETSDEDIKTVVQPDITVICDHSKLDDKGCKGAPDLIVEIVSPTSLKTDVKTKLTLYEKHGVREYWIVYPSDKSVVVYRLQPDGNYVLADAYARDEQMPVGIFDDFTIDLKEIFAD